MSLEFNLASPPTKDLLAVNVLGDGSSTSLVISLLDDPVSLTFVEKPIDVRGNPVVGGKDVTYALDATAMTVTLTFATPLPVSTGLGTYGTNIQLFYEGD